MKKLLIAVVVVCALPAVAAPPHQKPGLVHQYHESAAFAQPQHDSARGDTRAPATSAQRAKATEAPKSTERPYEQR